MEDGRMQGQWVVTYRNGKSYPYEYLDDEMVQDFSGTRTSLPSNYTAKSGTVSWGYSGGSESVEYVAGTQTAVGVYAEKKEGLQTFFSGITDFVTSPLKSFQWEERGRRAQSAEPYYDVQMVQSYNTRQVQQVAPRNLVKVVDHEVPVEQLVVKVKKGWEKRRQREKGGRGRMDLPVCAHMCTAETRKGGKSGGWVAD
jgi:hypothetical protein